MTTSQTNDLLIKPDGKIYGHHDDGRELGLKKGEFINSRSDFFIETQDRFGSNEPSFLQYNKFDARFSEIGGQEELNRIAILAGGRIENEEALSYDQLLKTKNSALERIVLKSKTKRSELIASLAEKIKKSMLSTKISNENQSKDFSNYKNAFIQQKNAARSDFSDKIFATLNISDNDVRFRAQINAQIEYSQKMVISAKALENVLLLEADQSKKLIEKAERDIKYAKVDIEKIEKAIENKIKNGIFHYASDENEYDFKPKTALRDDFKINHESNRTEYFSEKTGLIVDVGNALFTEKNNESTVRAVMRLAQEKKWQGILLSEEKAVMDLYVKYAVKTDCIELILCNKSIRTQIFAEKRAYDATKNRSFIEKAKDAVKLKALETFWKLPRDDVFVAAFQSIAEKFKKFAGIEQKPNFACSEDQAKLNEARLVLSQKEKILTVLLDNESHRRARDRELSQNSLEKDSSFVYEKELSNAKNENGTTKTLNDRLSFHRIDADFRCIVRTVHFAYQSLNSTAQFKAIPENFENADKNKMLSFVEMNKADSTLTREAHVDKIEKIGGVVHADESGTVLNSDELIEMQKSFAEECANAFQEAAECDSNDNGR